MAATETIAGVEWEIGPRGYTHHVGALRCTVSWFVEHRSKHVWVVEHADGSFLGWGGRISIDACAVEALACANNVLREVEHGQG